MFKQLRVAKVLTMMIVIAFLIWLLTGCAEGDLFPEFPDINVELVVPKVTEGEFTVIVVPDGPYPEYVIRGHVGFQDNVATVELWSIEVGGIYITPTEGE